MCRRNGKRSDYLLVLGMLGCGGVSAPSAQQQSCTGGKIWHEDDAARLRGCTQVIGDLHLGGALGAAPDLAEVASVRGDVTIGPSYQLTNLSSLRSVVRIEGDLRVVANWQLQGLFLGGLEVVGGAVEIRNNSNLATCSLQALRAFETLRIDGNRNLERVDLSGLDEAGPSGVVGGASLETVRGPARIRRQNPLQKPGQKGASKPGLYYDSLR